MSRKVDNWIKGFQFYTSESEAPDNYIFWAAMSAIAGVTQRKVYTKWVYQRFYPNMYVILVGPPATVHKSSTIWHIRELLREVGVPTSSESLSREELINQMIKRGTDDVAALTALPDELSDLIKISGPAMVEFLTSIYGCPNAWEYSTRARGTELMTNAFLNLLGGTTPRWMSTEFDESFIDQGFASRTLFIYESEPRFRKAFARVTPEMEQMREDLSHDLAHIGTLEGEFIWTSAGEKWFEHWYEQELGKELHGLDYRLLSYIGRKPTHLLKVAMLLQLAESDELILTAKNFEVGTLLLAEIEKSMARTFSAVGKNVYANDLERILADIKDAPGQRMTKAEIIQRNYHALGRKEMDDTIENLVLMSYIRPITEKGRIAYEYCRE